VHTASHHPAFPFRDVQIGEQMIALYEC